MTGISSETANVARLRLRVDIGIHKRLEEATVGLAEKVPFLLETRLRVAGAGVSARQESGEDRLMSSKDPNRCDRAEPSDSSGCAGPVQVAIARLTRGSPKDEAPIHDR